MRTILRISALILVLLALMIPLAGHAQVPCPDDPVASQNCDNEAPPYYVVLNRSEEHLADRPGTGCQPFILEHPDCLDCFVDAGGGTCQAIEIDVEVCQAVMAPRGLPPGDVYEMCCACATNPDGEWVYRIRYFDGSACPVQPGQEWQTGLPPGTGIDLPAPLIIGGAVLLGGGLLAAGLLVRRRSLQTG